MNQIGPSDQAAISPIYCENLSFLAISCVLLHLFVCGSGNLSVAGGVLSALGLTSPSMLVGVYDPSVPSCLVFTMV